MPTISIAKWIQITAVWSSEGSQKVNTFSYSYNGSSSSGPTTAELSVLAADWAATCRVIFNQCQGTGANFDRVEARWLGNEPHKYGEFVPTQPNPGLQAGELDPANAALCCTVKTGFMGRKYRGRSYLGGMTENVTQGSTALSSYLLNAISLAAAVRNFTGNGTTPVNMVVASRKYGFLTDVISTVINAQLDSQRRRLIGRGR